MAMSWVLASLVVGRRFSGSPPKGVLDERYAILWVHASGRHRCGRFALRLRDQDRGGRQLYAERRRLLQLCRWKERRADLQLHRQRLQRLFVRWKRRWRIGRIQWIWRLFARLW